MNPAIDMTKSRGSVRYDGTNRGELLELVKACLVDVTGFTPEDIDDFLARDGFMEGIGIDLSDGGFAYGPLQPGDVGHNMPWGMYWTRETTRETVVA